MWIKKTLVKGRPYYQIWDKGKFVKQIGNAEAYEKYLRDQERRALMTTKQPTPDIPDGKFTVAYADPPWQYDTAFDDKAIENHYPTLRLKDIRNLRDKNGVKIQDKFDTNCVLYLWATAPKLTEALEVIRTWGFIYKTNMVWVKDKIGLGWYCRNQHELLLIARKGNMPIPDAAVRPSSVQSFPRTTHSTKPKEFYDLIEMWYPNQRYLEVFGVGIARPNWTVFGNNIYDK